jgi:periplasmic protein TonB
MVARMQAPRPLHYTLGVSALGHAAFLLVAFFVFKVAVEPMQVRDLGESVQFETISIPHALFAPPPPEPEIVPAVAPEPKEEVEPAEPEKVRKAVKRRKVRKKAAAEPELAAAPVVESHDNSGEVSVPAPAGPAGAVDEPGIARSGADKGDGDAFSKVRQKLPVAAKVIDRGALTRGYVGRIGKILRKGKKYPRAAQRAREEGKVIVEVVIDGRGRIIKARVARSSGSRTLDEAAVAHVKALRTLPAPPSELGWTRKSFRVPFNYRFNR